MTVTDTTFSEYGGIASPGVAPAGKCRLYFDSTSNTFKMSQNGAAYANVAGGGGGGSTIGQGTYAARPGPGTAGNMYLPNDGYTGWIDNGTIWVPVIQGVVGVAPDAAASFTAANASGTSALADSSGALIASDATPTAAIPNYRIWYKAMSGGATAVEGMIWPAPDLTTWNAAAQSYTLAGILLRESATGKLAVMLISAIPGTYQIVSCEYSTSPTAGRTVVGGLTDKRMMPNVWPSSQVYFRMLIQGGNVNYQYAVGRTAWQTIATIATTTAFTTAPDQYGLVVWPYNNNNPSSVRIIVPHLTSY